MGLAQEDLDGHPGKPAWPGAAPSLARPRSWLHPFLAPKRPNLPLAMGKRLWGALAPGSGRVPTPSCLQPPPLPEPSHWPGRSRAEAEKPGTGGDVLAEAGSLGAVAAQLQAGAAAPEAPVPARASETSRPQGTEQARGAEANGGQRR